jgi:1,2-phenylacetyl-CoA epoxidase catalytic subunit
MLVSLQRYWNETLCWFGPADDPTMQHLREEDVINASPEELRSRYLAKIMPVLSNLELEFPVMFNSETQTWNLTQTLPWESWLAISRRVE